MVHLWVEQPHVLRTASWCPRSAPSSLWSRREALRRGGDRPAVIARPGRARGCGPCCWSRAASAASCCSSRSRWSSRSPGWCCSSPALAAFRDVVGGDRLPAADASRSGTASPSRCTSASRSMSATIGVVDAAGDRHPGVRPRARSSRCRPCTIEVARACSGVNYLVAVLALGLPLAYLYLRSWWRRVVLIVAALLIAALSTASASR